MSPIKPTYPVVSTGKDLLSCFLFPASNVHLQQYPSNPLGDKIEHKMGREDQIEEREVLDSIFPEEITG